MTSTNNISFSSKKAVLLHSIAYYPINRTLKFVSCTYILRIVFHILIHPTPLYPKPISHQYYLHSTTCSGRISVNCIHNFSFLKFHFHIQSIKTTNINATIKIGNPTYILFIHLFLLLYFINCLICTFCIFSIYCLSSLFVQYDISNLSLQLFFILNFNG